jgi:hypothetical protein
MATTEYQPIICPRHTIIHDYAPGDARFQGAAEIRCTACGFTFFESADSSMILPFELEMQAACHVGLLSKWQPSLADQRRSLIDAREGILDEIEAAREAAFNGDGPIPSYDSPEFRAAAAAIAAFDAEHPEVLASLKAERSARAEAHMWD